MNCAANKELSGLTAVEVLPMYSPHRDAGCSTLNFPAASHLRSVDTAAAIRQIQRSLSRSPSKGPTFRLITSKSTSPSPSSPLSPSPLSPNRSSTSPNLRSHHNEMLSANTAIPPNTRKSRAGVRKLSPHRQTKPANTPQPSPLKRGLSDSTDHGNATPSPPTGVGLGIENSPTPSPENKALFDSWSEHASPSMFDSHLAPRHALSMLDKSSTYPAGMPKSSPLKRSDCLMDLDRGNMGSPSAKRRSLHGAAFGADFNIFDCEFAGTGETLTSRPDSSLISEQSSIFAVVPKRTSSLRKSTLQQRYEKPNSARAKYNNDGPSEFTVPVHTPTSTRHRTPLENIFPSPARDSPFAHQGPLPNASIHPMPQNSKEQFLASMQTHQQRHPLSRTMTQSSTDSTVAEDSPTHVPFRVPETKRTVRDFSQSLPVGVARPDLRELKTRETDYTPSDGSFSTPENYKLAKPNLAAFMSTGLISKKNKNVDLSQPNFQRDIANMPDTPCKRPTSMVPTPKAVETATKLKQSRRSMHSFGTPSTPFNPRGTVVAPVTSGKGVNIFGSSFSGTGLTRRGSFASFEAEDIPLSPGKGQSQPSSDFDLPPTPSKSFYGASLQSNPDRRPSGALFSPVVADECGALNADVVDLGHNSKFTPKRPFFEPVEDDDDDDDDGGEMDGSPCGAMRFKNFDSISSYSTRSHLLRLSRSPSSPSKKFHTVPQLRTRNIRAKTSPLSPASPSHERHEQASPHTPFTSFSNMLPPDPSGLSISAREDGQAQHMSSSSNYPPATPTTPRDYFSQFGRRRTSITPVHTQVAADIDQSLTLRFDKVEPIGAGDFSQVYRVVQQAESSHGSPSLSRFTTTPDSIKSQKPSKIFAVKRSRNKFLGERDKQRKLQEVNILKALGQSDHIVRYIDSWERSGYLYIQTEYCEEGALDVFLGKVGMNARLDDFRIWKILLELSLVTPFALFSSVIMLTVLGGQAHSQL